MCLYGSTKKCDGCCNGSRPALTLSQIESLFRPMPQLPSETLSERPFLFESSCHLDENEAALEVLQKQSASLNALHHELQSSLMNLKSELQRSDRYSISRLKEGIKEIAAFSDVVERLHPGVTEFEHVLKLRNPVSPIMFRGKPFR